MSSKNGPNRIARQQGSWSTLAKPTLAKSSLICCVGVLCVLCVVCCVCCVLCVLCVVCVCGGLCVLLCMLCVVCVVRVSVVVVEETGWRGLGSADRPPAGPPSAGPPKISAFFFFFPLPPPYSLFFASLGVFSWNFGGVFEGRDPQMCTFGLLGCRVKPPAALGPCGISGGASPALQKHHQNSTRRPPQREKERKWEREREKKAKFWAVRRRGGPAGGRSAEPKPRHPVSSTTTTLTRTTHTTHNTHSNTHNPHTPTHAHTHTQQ